MENVYLCIDLKSFYASVECVERGLDALKTNLVVADSSRGGGAICLAVSPSMKALGVRNRCRVFEIPEGLDYIMAMPRMKKYMEVSSNVYQVYLKYVSPSDIHVYSIDECFLDVTRYLSLYGLTPVGLARRIIKDVLDTTKITATAGIGPNLFLSKVALDIISKHAKDGIGVLDEEKFKEELWDHTPITDFWNISTGTANRLLKYGITTLRGVCNIKEDILYKEFGVNAELLIDHAHGIEPCTIEDIKKYKPKNNSISQSQILFENYKVDDALLILKEMVDGLVLELVEKELVTNHVGLNIVYSSKYGDHSERSGGSHKLSGYTSSKKKILDAFLKIFNDNVDRTKLIRGVGVTLGNVIPSDFSDIDLFTDFEQEDKERRMQEAIIEIKNRFGKDSILKAMNLDAKSTQRKRNKLVGGHNGE